MPFRFNPFTDKLDLTETGGGPGSGIQTITGNDSVAVGPDGNGNVNLLGSGALAFSGDAGTNTETGQISGTANLLLASNGTGVDATFQDFLNNNFTFTNSAQANTNRTVTVESTDVTGFSNAGFITSCEFDSGLAFFGYPYYQWVCDGLITWTAAVDPLNPTGAGGSWRLGPTSNPSAGGAVVITPDSTFFIQSAGFVVHANQPTDPTYNMTETDMAIFRSAFGAQTFVLPGSGQNQGQIFIISDQNGTAATFNVTIDGNGQLINGASTYVINQNFGSAIVMWSGSNWCVVGGSNESFAPVLPAVQAQVNSAVVADVTGDNTLYTIIFDSVQLDATSNYDPSTGIFTAPVSGAYFASATIGLFNVTTSTLATMNLNGISKTNQYYSINPLNVISPNTECSLTTSTILNMTAGDTFQVTIQVSGGAGTKTVGLHGDDAGAWTFFCIYLIA